jgi:magnesium transporter
MTINPLSLHFIENHPQDAARVLEKFEPELLAKYLEHVPVKVSANLLRNVIPSVAVECLTSMEPARSAKILEQFSIERASSILRRMKINIRNDLIKIMSPIFANMIRLVLRYPNGTVGQLMTPKVYTVNQNMLIKDILETLQGMTGQLQNLIYVINNEQRLVGVVDVRDVITLDSKAPVKTVMRDPGLTISARASLDSVKDYNEWRYTEILPVVDHMGMFIGVLKRGVLLDTLARDRNNTNQKDEIAGAALAIAELFWDACANMLAPETKNTGKVNQDE